MNVVFPNLILFFFIPFTLLWTAGLAFWIYCIVDVARVPDMQFRAVGSEKTVWVLIVVLAGLIGALVWWFAKRGDVHRAHALPAPAGWYPDAGGALRWWDGWRWGDPYHPPPPPHPYGWPGASQ